MFPRAGPRLRLHLLKISFSSTPPNRQRAPAKVAEMLALLLCKRPEESGHGRPANMLPNRAPRGGALVPRARRVPAHRTCATLLIPQHLVLPGCHPGVTISRFPTTLDFPWENKPSVKTARSFTVVQAKHCVADVSCFSQRHHQKI